MTKKYLPFIVLLAAALLLFFIKRNQRGTHIPGTSAGTSIPVVTREGFNRKAAQIIYSRHALCRMDCRHIDKREVLEILENGQINFDKVEEDSRGKKYPLEGITRDQQHVRIVFAREKDELVVVTVIDLDRDWDCNCEEP